MFLNKVVENYFGTCYPTEQMEQMAAALGIQADDRVIDVGGGANPLPQAQVVVDYNPFSSHDRDGHTAKLDARWLAADIENLPFKDNSFDFAYCSHVLEHVRDPVRACQELSRIARRGYIETPNKYTEYYAGYPSHRWLVDMHDKVLSFEKRWFVESPFQNVLLVQAQHSQQLRQQALYEYRNFTCNQLLWEGEIYVEVVEKNYPTVFDYDDEIQAGWSHYYFALNLLAGQVNPQMVVSHLDIAKENLSGEYQPFLLSVLVSILLEQWQQAKDMMKQVQKRLQSGPKQSVDPAFDFYHQWLQQPQLSTSACTRLMLPMGRGFISKEIQGD